MGLSKRIIVLEDHRDVRFRDPKHEFRVKKVTNSTEYKINQFLSTNEADMLIRQDWTVNIIAR